MSLCNNNHVTIRIKIIELCLFLPFIIQRMTIIRFFRPTFCAPQHCPLLPLISIRSYSTPPFKSRPAPVPLADPKEQKEFEELVRKNQESFNAQMEELSTHPDLQKKQSSQFEGDKNPETGEIGGPK